MDDNEEPSLLSEGAIDSNRYLLCLEGGGTRCQAALLSHAGTVVHISESTSVNTNFVSLAAAQTAVLVAVTDVLEAAGVDGERVAHFVSALVGPRFGPELFGDLIPNASYHTYTERDVVFARAGSYEPHGVAVVSATGATVWGVRSDDGRTVVFGGWGALLGDEGSAYAVGESLLRTATRVHEGRIATPTRLVQALSEHFHLEPETFRSGLCRVAYQGPLSRADIAGLAPIVTRLAAHGDVVALQILRQVSSDLADLALHAASSLFGAREVFDVAAAGGLLNAGALMIDPLRQRLAKEFPNARLSIGTEEPAVALGRLALHDQSL